MVVALEENKDVEIGQEKGVILKELTDRLYHAANRTVGKVGESTERSLSVTGEPYIEFAMYFNNEDEIMPIWEKWIKAYMEFAKYMYPSYNNKIYNGCPLVIYWRVLPEIRKCEEVNILRARLLVSARGEATILTSPLQCQSRLQ